MHKKPGFPTGSWRGRYIGELKESWKKAGPDESFLFLDAPSSATMLGYSETTQPVSIL
jgi:hypothetical protein